VCEVWHRFFRYHVKNTDRQTTGGENPTPATAVGVGNKDVHRCTEQPSLIGIVHTRRLKLFSNIMQANPSMDHNQALQTCLNPLPTDWNHPSGRPRRTWLHMVESYLNVMISHCQSADSFFIVCFYVSLSLCVFMSLFYYVFFFLFFSGV